VQSLPSTMNGRVDGIAWTKRVCLSECVSDNHFIVAARLGQPTGTQKNQIELLRGVLRN